ncbi:hypothetical protein ACFVW5_06485 [Streptomyces sp. NPDC058232]|uniref:hypothetical protein n=1 Tax=Streptomyces sp. NPDC058232 TaxID=3346393 RepID=UPI0036EB6B4D
MIFRRHKAIFNASSGRPSGHRLIFEMSSHGGDQHDDSHLTVCPCVSSVAEDNLAAGSSDLLRAMVETADDALMSA